MLLYDDLTNLDKEKQIKVALVGAGFMGIGITEMVAGTPGMEIVAISDKDISKAAKAFESIGISDYKNINHKKEISKLDLTNNRIMTENYRLIPERILI